MARVSERTGIVQWWGALCSTGHQKLSSFFTGTASLLTISESVRGEFAYQAIRYVIRRGAELTVIDTE